MKQQYINVAPFICKYCLIDADLFQLDIEDSPSCSIYSPPALNQRDNVKTGGNVKGVLSDLAVG